MALFHSPKVATSGLVFMYDTGNSKSYVGEPTTNLVPGVANPTLSTSGWYNTGWNGGISIDTDEGALVLNATNGWRSMSYDFGVTNGTVTVQFDYKLKSAEHTNIYMVVLNGTHLGSYTQFLDGSLYPSLDEYKTYKKTFNTTTDSKICIVLRGTDNAGLTDEMFIKNLQVEAKSHATPFVNGTRSATEGLIDRTGNTTIDLSNVSFDSNAQPTFDGTDDYIDLGDLGLGNDPFTVEAVIYPKASSTYHVFFRKGDDSTSNTNMDWSMGYDYNQFHFRTQNASVSINEYAGANFINNYGHVAVTYDGSTIIMYLNGSEVSNKTVTLANNYSNYSVGRGINNYAQLDVKTLKVYERTLTAAEILKNFNAIRSRFGL